MLQECSWAHAVSWHLFVAKPMQYALPLGARMACGLLAEVSMGAQGLPAVVTDSGQEAGRHGLGLPHRKQCRVPDEEPGVDVRARLADDDDDATGAELTAAAARFDVAGAACMWMAAAKTFVLAASTAARLYMPMSVEGRAALMRRWRTS
jgi:hypothetical protein